MELVLILIEQILMMFFLMAIGFLLRKRQFFKDDHLQTLSFLLLNLIMPFTLFFAFMRDFSVSLGLNLLITFGLGIVCSVVAVLVPSFIFKRSQGVEIFTVAFSNVSFMGIPLVIGLLGQEYVFYMAAYIAVFNLFVWTFGVYFLTQDKVQMSFRKVIFNPNIMAIIVGILFFLSPWKPFPFMLRGISAVGNMSTPVSMLVIGAFLADCDFVLVLKRGSAWLVALLRLLIAPMVSALLLWWVPRELNAIKLLVMIAACTPSATSAAMMCKVYGKDHVYASSLVSLTTILSFMTMPLIVYFVQWLYGVV